MPEVYHETACLGPFRAILASGNTLGSDVLVARRVIDPDPVRAGSDSVNGEGGMVRRAWTAFSSGDGLAESRFHHAGGPKLFRVRHHRGKRGDDAWIASDDGSQSRSNPSIISSFSSV